MTITISEHIALMSASSYMRRDGYNEAANLLWRLAHELPISDLETTPRARNVPANKSADPID